MLVGCLKSGLVCILALHCSNTNSYCYLRSIISLGLSAFRLMPSSLDAPSLNYQVQTFNIMILCSEDYIVEPGSLKFLVEHGFDFTKQYSKGLPYYRGNDKVNIFPDLDS